MCCILRVDPGFVPSLHPALMGLYVGYGNYKPWTKFERFVVAGITCDDAKYSCKVNSGAGADFNHLKECAYCITQ
jgi:hypothetical protein